VNGEEHEIDRYELALRRKSARTSIAAGLVCLVLALGFFVALGVSVLFLASLPWALPVLGGGFGIAGVRAIHAGLQARSRARELEARLGRYAA
jgi:hypothetical protein